MAKKSAPAKKAPAKPAPKPKAPAKPAPKKAQGAVKPEHYTGIRRFV